MKKIFYILAVMGLFMTTSCEKDNIWGEGDPAYEHIYYVGFYKSIKFDYYVTFEIAANGASQWREGSTTANGTWQATEPANVAGVPFEFHSERVRTYDAVSKFWVVANGLSVGGDYTLTLEDGTALSPDGSGVYSIIWTQAKKGVKKVLVTRKSAAVGDLKFYTLNPASILNTNDLPTTVNNKTDDCEVRGLSHDIIFDKSDYTKPNITNSTVTVYFR
ncbi:MAG: hypothetical protein LBT25_03670 [Candidatus Symbiothrix sp.]|nr:hypothetical protein [Candidatus Symbiothrix sp.]